jgi:hypothetical protein
MSVAAVRRQDRRCDHRADQSGLRRPTALDLALIRWNIIDALSRDPSNLAKYFAHFVWLKLSYSSIDGTPFRALWRLTIQSFVYGLLGFDRRKRQTPPRQSRGNSNKA